MSNYKALTDLDWPCPCGACVVSPYIYVLMTERVMRQPDGTYLGDEDPEVVQHGYPVFWRRGKPDGLDYKPPHNVMTNPFGPDWTKDIAHAVHYVHKGEAETAQVEAILFHPSLIGKVRVMPFRIR